MNGFGSRESFIWLQGCYVYYAAFGELHEVVSPNAW